MGMTHKQYRFYRYHHQAKKGWVVFQVRHRETDLWIRARYHLEEEALAAVLNCRHQLERYIERFPAFLKSLQPLPDDPFAPNMIREMLHAARAAGVGPMAGVAGAIAETAARALKSFSNSVIIENGGDCYLDLDEDINVGVHAGPRSPFKDRIALHFPAARLPLSVCTSSGTIGHSLSFGKADAVTVVSKNAALADAAATALGNLVKGPSDIGRALERASLIPGVDGALVLVKDKMGAWGKIELVGPNTPRPSA